ncbi:hypothetical protein PVAG01_09129 [Phlyctema vagabunda]|uniref:SAP domain-containing protein n=1 Tax=Phlyctema vagabunda TaxID=108571 RepID=A0ABR4P6H1_9HELO
MSYRVETASSGRAVCKNTECKKEGVKIDKDELRLGVWVSFEDRGSWAWRHWGCVTGKMIENLRKYLEGEDNLGSGVYRWDFLDGFEGGEKNSLDHHPDLQEKVKRVITQGFIDPEDWNGDPEMNRIGQTGTRTTETKRKMRADKLNREEELKDLQDRGETINEETTKVKPESSTSKKMSSKKRSKAELSEDDDDNKKPATKKQRGKKAVKDENDNEEVIPAKKSKGKKAVKDENDNEEVMPAKKSRGKKAVKDEEPEDIKPAKKSQGKEAKKEEPVSSPSAEDETPDWSKFSVQLLKQELGNRGLSKSGKKADLIARLEEADGTDELSNNSKTDPVPSSPPVRRKVKKESSTPAIMADAPSSASEPETEASLPLPKVM